MSGRGPVVWLDELRLEDLPSVGGKLARLAELASRGYEVPRGFVLPVATLRAAIPTDTLEEVGRLLELVPAGSAGLARVAAEIRDAVVGAPLSPEVDEAVRAAYARLGEGEVAVRSSGIDEDGASASFAGQFDTYLGIRGADAVVEHVKRCWASQYSPRALDYCRRKGLPAGAGGMAVGVLELVPAVSAGIAMTLDPIHGDRDRVVIEANWGLGESVVSGRVTPDRWVVEKETGRVVESTIGDKAEWSVFDPDVGRATERPAPKQQREAPCLEEGDVLRIAQVAGEIERSEGCPQDVEWALERDSRRLVLLQHRPETAWGDRQPEAFDPVAFTMRNVLGVRGTEGEG